MNLKKYIADIPNFPKEGILFHDITPLMANGPIFKYCCDKMQSFAEKCGAEVIFGPEARGFIFGCPVAASLGIGFVPVRKPGKLPRETVSVSYDLEYGSNSLSIHKDAIVKGQKVVIIDDLLATGGTIQATAELVEKLGGIVVGFAFLVELEELKGRDGLKNIPVLSLISY